MGTFGRYDGPQCPYRQCSSVNGIATKTWDSATKENLTGSIASAYVSPIGRQLPLLIGAAATVYDEAATWEWDSWKTPDGWDSMEGGRGWIFGIVQYDADRRTGGTSVPDAETPGRIFIPQGISNTGLRS